MTELEVRKRVAKLMAIYDKHPNTPEGKNALNHAKRLIDKYKLEAKKAPKAPSKDHPFFAIATAFKRLVTTKPQAGVPDLGELERRLTKLLNNA